MPERRATRAHKWATRSCVVVTVVPALLAGGIALAGPLQTTTPALGKLHAVGSDDVRVTRARVLPRVSATTSVKTRVLAVRLTRPAPKPAISRRQVTPTVRGCIDQGAGWVQARGAKALARVSYPWRTLGYTVAFLPRRSGYLGMTYPAAHRIELYIRSCRAETNDMLAITLAHELGHAFDTRYGTDARRAEWLRIRGAASTTPWFPRGSPVRSDFAYGCGDFAEVFALAQINGSYYLSQVAARPTASELARLQHLMQP